MELKVAPREGHVSRNEMINAREAWEECLSLDIIGKLKKKAYCKFTQYAFLYSVLRKSFKIFTPFMMSASPSLFLCQFVYAKQCGVALSN